MTDIVSHQSLGQKNFWLNKNFLFFLEKNSLIQFFKLSWKKTTSWVCFEELIITPTKFVIISLENYFLGSFKWIDNLKPHFLHFVISFSILIEPLFVILLEILISFAAILLLFVVFSFRKIFISFTRFSLNLFFVLLIISCWHIFRHLYISKRTLWKKILKKIYKKS